MEVAMNESEKAFLAQVALGWFEVRTDGSIWRHVKFHGGGVSGPNWITPTRAERSTSAKEGGYLRVLFNDAGRRLKVNANRIVWMVANQADLSPLLDVNHEDGNKQNNAPGNLTPATRTQNVNHSFKVLGQRTKEQRGEMNSAAKLTAQQVAEIRELALSRSMSQREIGNLFGITQSTVSAIVLRKSWNL